MHAWTRPVGLHALVCLPLVIALTFTTACADNAPAPFAEEPKAPPEDPVEEPVAEPTPEVEPPAAEPEPIAEPVDDMIRARYAPFVGGDVPMPNDIWRDAEAERLDVPVRADDSPAEQAFREYLNTLDGWSTAFAGSVDFTGPIDAATIDEDTVQVWLWGEEPERLEVIARDVARGNTRIVIEPPREGWPRNAEVVMLVRGGEEGVRALDGGLVGSQPVFDLVRSTEPTEITFLEEVRQALAPCFEWLEGEAPEHWRVPREEIAALWRFTVTGRTELAMDPASQRVPIPFDLLLDPDTGIVALDAAEWDSELEVSAKAQLSTLNGFAVSSELLFELTGPVDASTATTDHVRLIDLHTGESVPLAHVRVLADDPEADCGATPVPDDCRHLAVEVDRSRLPLEGAHRYGIEVSDGLRDAKGDAIVPMLIGHFMTNPHPLTGQGRSLISSLTFEDAERLEKVRKKIAPLLEERGREGLVTAWPFTTLDVWPDLDAAIHEAETRDIPLAPVDVTVTELRDGLLSGPADRADAFKRLFPDAFFVDPVASTVRNLYAPRLEGVGAIVEGKLPTPYLLDRVTRGFRADKGHEVENVPFLMTIPAEYDVEKPLPIVIFGHAIVTDRRFVMAVAGALAKRGFAAVSIDMPFHGDRTVCIDSSLVSLPNFLPELLQDITGLDGQMLQLPPCVSGADATCSPEGQCIGPDGQPEPLATFLRAGDKALIMDMKPASGAAFLDLNDLAHLRDHFVQALVDVGALKRSLASGVWNKALGIDFDTEKFWFAGQSLGGIVASVYTSIDPDITRAVWNVPGGDMVNLFQDSVYFKPQVEAFFEREHIIEGTWEQTRLVNIAHWLIDTVDPQSVSQVWQSGEREALIQMCTGDFIIPNTATEAIERVSGLPVVEYGSPLHGDLVIPLLGLGMLGDMADFLATGQVPQ